MQPKTEGKEGKVFMNRKQADVISAGLDRGKLFPEVDNALIISTSKPWSVFLPKWQLSRTYYRRFVSSDGHAGELYLTRRWAPRVKTQVMKTATLNFNLLHIQRGLLVKWRWLFYYLGYKRRQIDVHSPAWVKPVDVKALVRWPLNSLLSSLRTETNGRC